MDCRNVPNLFIVGRYNEKAALATSGEGHTQASILELAGLDSSFINGGNGGEEDNVTKTDVDLSKHTSFNDEGVMDNSANMNPLRKETTFYVGKVLLSNGMVVHGNWPSISSHFQVGFMAKRYGNSTYYLVDDNQLQYTPRTITHARMLAMMQNMPCDRLDDWSATKTKIISLKDVEIERKNMFFKGSRFRFMPDAESEMPALRNWRQRSTGMRMEHFRQMAENIIVEEVVDQVKWRKTHAEDKVPDRILLWQYLTSSGDGVMYFYEEQLKRIAGLFPYAVARRLHLLPASGIERLVELIDRNEQYKLCFRETIPQELWYVPRVTYDRVEVVLSKKIKEYENKQRQTQKDDSRATSFRDRFKTMIRTNKIILNAVFLYERVLCVDVAGLPPWVEGNERWDRSRWPYTPVSTGSTYFDLEKYASQLVEMMPHPQFFMNTVNWMIKSGVVERHEDYQDHISLVSVKKTERSLVKSLAHVHELQYDAQCETIAEQEFFLTHHAHGQKYNGMRRSGCEENMFEGNFLTTTRVFCRPNPDNPILNVDYSFDPTGQFPVTNVLLRPTSENEKHLNFTLSSDQLSDEQRRAFAHAVAWKSEWLTCITGRGGTGKTQTLQKLANWHGWSKADIMVTTLTGRCAQELARKTDFDCYTMHMWMKMCEEAREYFGTWNYVTIEDDIASFGQNQWATMGEEDRAALDTHLTVLQKKVLVIDEMSMTDTKTLSNLMQALRAAHVKIRKVIFIGDKNQLYPIGYGSVFMDVIREMPDVCFELTKNFRNSASAIFENTDLIALQQPEFIRWCSTFRLEELDQYSRDLQRQKHQSSSSRRREKLSETQIKDIVLGFLKKHPKLVQQNTQFISFTRAEVRGVNQACREAWHAIKGADRGYYVGEQVCFTKNNYQLGVFNGQLLTIVDVRDVIEEAAEDATRRPRKKRSRADGGDNDNDDNDDDDEEDGDQKATVKPRKYREYDSVQSTASRLSRGRKRVVVLQPVGQSETFQVWTDKFPFTFANVRHAYCLTVHKFQGSQQQNVVYFIGNASANASWQLAYTGCTRSEDIMWVLAMREDFNTIVRRHSEPRRSHFAHDLTKELAKVKDRVDKKRAEEEKARQDLLTKPSMVMGTIE